MSSAGCARHGHVDVGFIRAAMRADARARADYAALGAQLRASRHRHRGDHAQGRAVSASRFHPGAWARAARASRVSRARRAAQRVREARGLRGHPCADRRDADGVAAPALGHAPTTITALREHGAALGLGFDAMNSNTFQDQAGQPLSYKFGSLTHTDRGGARTGHRAQSRLHPYRAGAGLQGADASGSATARIFPGQQHLVRAFERYLESHAQIYTACPPTGAC